MKRLIFLLFLLPGFLSAQDLVINGNDIGPAVKMQFLPYFPTASEKGLLAEPTVEKYPKSSPNPTGYVILKPSTYVTTESFPVVVFVHGAGGRGDGSSSALDALVSTQIPSNLKAAAEKYKFLIIAPQYADAGNNSFIDYTISKALAIPGANASKVLLTCFSMGGGEITRWVTASQANADKLSLMVVVAGLNGLQSGGIKYIIQSKLPVIYFHANDDGSASVNYSKNGMAAINALNPEIPAKGVFYANGGHDITNRVFDADKFPWTGNEIPNNLLRFTK